MILCGLKHFAEKRLAGADLETRARVLVNDQEMRQGGSAAESECHGLADSPKTDKARHRTLIDALASQEDDESPEASESLEGYTSVGPARPRPQSNWRDETIQRSSLTDPAQRATLPPIRALLDKVPQRKPVPSAQALQLRDRSSAELGADSDSDPSEGTQRHLSSDSPSSMISTIRPTSVHYYDQRQAMGRMDADLADNSGSLILRRRTRLDADQAAALEREYQINQRWSTRHISSLAKRLGVRHTKVYKWCYDRRKKDRSLTPVI